MSVLIYQDYVHNNGLLYRSLCRHFGTDNVEFCDAADIDNGCLDNAKLLILPGGADLYYCEKLDGARAGTIKSWVKKGGCYLGICAGAYYGCASIEWAKGQGDLEISGPRQLAFFPGTAVGPIYDFIEDRYFDKSWQAAVPLVYDDGTTATEILTFYEAGPFFVPYGDESSVRVLARYANMPGRPAAIVECTVGAGKAILCGPHPEVTYSGLERRLYRHRNPSFAWEQGVAAKLNSWESTGWQIWVQLLNRCVKVT